MSILQPPETLWGYEAVTAAYEEKPEEPWQKIFNHVREEFPDGDEKEILKLIGKRP